MKTSPRTKTLSVHFLTKGTDLHLFLGGLSIGMNGTKKERPAGSSCNYSALFEQDN